MLEHDLENTPLLIKTNTDTGLVSSEKIWIKLFDSTDVEIGEIVIYLRQNPYYRIGNCMRDKEEMRSLPSEINKEWAIQKQPGPKLTVECNEKMVLKILMSSSTCSVNVWESNWDKRVSKILFGDDDDASDYFESTALAGNVQFYYFSIHGRH